MPKMNLLDKLAMGIGYYKKEQEPMPEWYLQSAGVNSMGGIPDPSTYGNQADLFRRLSWINIAVNLVSYAAATATYRVKKLEDDKNTDIINHPFEKLLRRPNSEQSQFDFFQNIFGYIMLTGNAYVWLSRESNDQPPLEMWVIPTPYIKPILSEKLGVSHYEYDPGLGKQIKIPKHQIVHLRTFNPNNMFVGLSPVEAVGTVAYGDLKMQEWNTNFFSKQNAKIPGALAFADNLDNVTFDKVKREVQEQWGGTSRFGPMLLRNVGTGVNWVQMGLTQAEMEFISSREMNRDEIFSLYAPGLLSMISPKSTEANARIGKATFTEFTLWPMLQIIDQKFTQNPLPVYGEDLLFIHDDIRVTDKLTELREEDQYAVTHTVDEIRKEYYDDEPIGDERGKLFPAEIKSVGGWGNEDQMTPREHTTSGEVNPANGRESQELKAWFNYEVKRLGKKTKRDFVCDTTPLSVQSIVNRELAYCKDADSLKKLFEYAQSLMEIHV